MPIILPGELFHASFRRLQTVWKANPILTTGRLGHVGRSSLLEAAFTAAGCFLGTGLWVPAVSLMSDHFEQPVFRGLMSMSLCHDMLHLPAPSSTFSCFGDCLVVDHVFFETRRSGL